MLQQVPEALGECFCTDVDESNERFRTEAHVRDSHMEPAADEEALSG